MAGIYIHIPFCNSKCAYCGFYSIPTLKRKGDFLDALRLEMLARKDYLEGESIGTIYFGGGTPSILSVEEIGTILQWITDVFTVNADAEITLEANPDTLSLDYLKGLRAIGVNRLSVGIQSFFDNDLKYLSRRHDSNHARQCLGWARQAGFDNVSVDLIYGLPTSDAEQWKRNLDLFFETGIPHLSAYSLTLEPNSILIKQIEKGMALPISEDDALRDYEILCARTKEEGFLHYEISNFCKPGFHSRHNSSYWFGVPYLGLGPSAHSYNGSSRQWNVSSVGGYLEVWNQETEDRSQETGDRRQKTGDRRQETEVRRQETEDRSQETEDRRQETEDRRQETEDRRQDPSSSKGILSESLPIRNTTRECGGEETRQCGGEETRECGEETRECGGAARECGGEETRQCGGAAPLSDTTRECGDVARECGGAAQECGGAAPLSDTTRECGEETRECGEETRECGDVARQCGGAENLTPEQVYDEYVMLHLRTMWGIDLKYLKREMGERFAEHCARKALPLIEEGRLSQIREFLYLTDEQMLFADGVAEALFW